MRTVEKISLKLRKLGYTLDWYKVPINRIAASRSLCKTVAKAVEVHKFFRQLNPPQGFEHLEVSI